MRALKILSGMPSFPTYKYEEKLKLQGYSNIVGVDEVGRGPIAGPVFAAAVVLDPNHIPMGLNDSKKLSAKKRNLILSEIMKHADVSVGSASEREIEETNILQASHLAMVRAIDGLKSVPGYILIDGNLVPSSLDIPATALIRGDASSVSIAAASIVAKVKRDLVMCDLGQHFPGYGWEKNAGYPTQQHLSALQDLGITPHHRRTFRPVRNILYQDKI
jgi:ribonuclease HII|tara:strand:- start:1959 stop:2612 length:654 start_codon:yes stop_codon:yes gene_type:complete